MEKSFINRYFILPSLPIVLGILAIAPTATEAVMECTNGTCPQFSDSITGTVGGATESVSPSGSNSDPGITVSTNKSSYNQGDGIVISGKVNGQLSDEGVLLRIENPSMDLISILNIAPASDGSFSRTIFATGPLWTAAGTYAVIAQYGTNTDSNSSFYFGGGNGQYDTNSLVFQPTSGGTLVVGFSTNPTNPNPGDQVRMQIYFIHKISMSVQPQIDYRVIVMQDNNQIFGIPITHTADGTVNIPIQLNSSGTYRVKVEADGILYQPITPATATFSLVVGTGQNNTSSNQVIPSVPEFPFATPILFASIMTSILYYKLKPEKRK